MEHDSGKESDVTTAAAQEQGEKQPGTEHAARGSATRTGEMRVSATSNPQSLAAAISHAIYDNRPVTLRAIGAGAICQAMKALAIARGFVGPRGIDLSVIPGWANVTGSHGDELSAMTFRVVLLS